MDFSDTAVALPLVNSPEICLLEAKDYFNVITFSTNFHVDEDGNVKFSSGYKTYHLARFILGITDDRFVADHADRNKMNNLRYNLRAATYQQNTFNKRKQINSKSRYKGVQFHKGAYIARITKNGITYHLGCFQTEIDAALAYNKKAKELFGKFACINET